MRRGTTFSLKTAVFLIGFTVLALCIFWLPWLASNAAELNPEFAHLQYPILVGIYGTVIPFFIALYQAIKILNYIDSNNAFSALSIKALKYIKYCAITISILYVTGSILLTTQNALHPGIAIIGFVIVFATIVIAVFSALLHKLLKNALEIKSENDLTV